MTKILVGFAALLGVCAAFAASPVTSLTGADGRISISGVSVMPPKGNDWQVMLASTHQLAIGRRGDRQGDTYIANVQLYRLPELTTEDDFKKAISKGRLAEPETGRFRLVRNDEEFAAAKGTWCVRYHTVAEDNAARTQTGIATMIRDEYGYHCRHPKNITVGVFFSFSVRSQASSNEQLESQAAEFLEQVLFTDF